MDSESLAQSEKDLLRQYIRDRHVPESLGGQLLELKEGERRVVCEILRQIRPSANALRDLLELVMQIARRDGISWEALFSQAAPRAALSEESLLSAKDRHRELKNFLTEKRFPETTRIRAALETERKQILRDCSLSLKLPEHLEGERLEMQLSFDSLEEVQNLSDKFSVLARHPSLARVFALLKGEA